MKKGQSLTPFIIICAVLIFMFCWENMERNKSVNLINDRIDAIETYFNLNYIEGKKITENLKSHYEKIQSITLTQLDVHGRRTGHLKCGDGQCSYMVDEDNPIDCSRRCISRNGEIITDVVNAEYTNMENEDVQPLI